ncbi:MAG: Heavy metal transport/detoxification protein [candidate division WS6 bacterium GW2011_GWE1_34_7]|uniref:Heavy metal transport/detoxification protein n=1 Tax=candidate division WS6 bacterium GW2011_GWE1_34_7 TaxID=1619093 RepID=A0A0G0BNV4_9BACT|nr:MAG: Heavy metal transport/detoxification protein [candidate division WS6 bacterium GW2011_GWE1_34_7]
MKKENYGVQGMHCKTCEVYIESQFKDIKGVTDIKTDSNKQTLSFSTREGTNTKEIIDEINRRIKDSGYKINKEVKEKNSSENIPLAFVIASLIMLFFWGLQKMGIGNNLFSGELSFTMVFILGVVASLSSCMAVVGALVLSFSSIIAQKENFKSSMIIFHVSRLIAFFILGGILGVLGSLILLTSDIQLVVSILLFIVMVVLALDMLDLFPISSITLPKTISQKIFNTKKVGYIFTPVLFGIATFFLPCGFTQSMQIQ